MSSNILILVCITLLFINGVLSHSWLDCSNWKLNDPTGYTTTSAARFADADGTCNGYARRFEVGIKPFGKMDEVQFYRHYVQGTATAACRRNAGTSSVDGSNEGQPSVRSAAYAPNVNPYSQVWGKMAQVYAGDPICWRWPAKNHMAHVDAATNMVLVYWDSEPNRATEKTQSELAAQLPYAQLPFANCPVAGPASNGDQTGVGSELRPCGGCFTVPTRQAGIYTVQWNWPFKGANAETYTSCTDIEILASTTNANCAVSAWSSWAACSSDCGSGTTTRTRTITTRQQGNGTACPAPVSNSETQVCNTGACVNYLSEHVVYDDALRGFQDWSWASSYSLTSTTRYSGTYGISWTPTAYDAIYLHYPTGGDIKDYQRISFWINGGTGSGQSMWFSVVTAGASTSTSLFNYQVPRTSIKANTWTQVNLTFADIGAVSGAFDGLWFQANGDGAQATVYIDDIYFMHMHQGGATPVVVDACASVSCGSNSACSAGSCICTNGYAATSSGACTIAPSVSAVTVKTLATVVATTINGTEILRVTWTSTGTLSTVTLTLENSLGTSPDVIASQIANGGSYFWTVPTNLVAATYYIRVSYSSSVSARSSALVKSTAAILVCADVDCSGHGVCNEDSEGKCVCRYGYTGTLCGSAPSSPVILRLSGSLTVTSAYSSYVSDAAKFKRVFRADLASALIVVTDQIEVTRVSQSSTSAVVAFDVLFGGLFTASPLSLSSTAALTAVLSGQLNNTDSSLNRGTNSYSTGDSLSAASSLLSYSIANSIAIIIITMMTTLMSLAW